MKGFFIVVDGIDGSGKSEIVKMLHNYLFSKHKKYRILTTREPTNGHYGSRIRKMLREEKDPKASSRELLGLFIKDRAEHLKNTIEPFLRASGRVTRSMGSFSLSLRERMALNIFLWASL